MGNRGASCQRLWALALLLVLACMVFPTGAGAASAAPWTPPSFPNPQKDIMACGRHGVKSFICDPDGVLSYEQANLLEGLISQVERGEPPYAKGPCGAGQAGYQIAVALMQHMAMDAHSVPADTAAAFARALHDAWGVGARECSNGVLLLLSTGDRQVYISTGTGAESGGLGHNVLLRVMDNMKPALRAHKYDQAVLEAVHELGLALAGQEVPASGDKDGDGLGIFLFFSSIVAAVFGWGWWNNRRQSRRFKTCQQKLEALKRDQAALRRGQYRTTTCPICLEDFEGDSGETGMAAAGTSSAAAGKDAPGLAGIGETAPLLQAAAGPSISSAVGNSSGRSTKAADRRPLVLRCGHSFCSPCISEWVKGHTTCPVCRRDIDNPEDETTTAGPSQRQPCAPTAAAQQQRVEPRQEVWIPELLFRTRRLGLLYPDYLDPYMTSSLISDIEQGREFSDTVMSAFEARHPARDAVRRAELRDSGRMGASVSFGGGSGNGGGAGSSW